MRYEIKGEPLPVVIVYLDAGESIKCEKGAMSWMTPNMKMETGAGSVGKAFSRMFSGESMFQNTYTAEGGPGMIAFASSFPGSIIPVDVSKGDFIVQKSGYLASEPSVAFHRVPEEAWRRIFRRRGLHHAEAARNRYGFRGDRRLCC